MTNIWKILKILGYATPFIILIFGVYSEQIFKPDVKISVLPEQYENFTSTIITVENTGAEPATNLRITFNPRYEIINFQTLFYTEEIQYEQTGRENIVGKMDRLANQQKIQIQTILNVSESDFSHYTVYATHDKGSTTFNYSPAQELPYGLGIAIQLLWMGIVASIIGTLFTFIKKIKFENESNHEELTKKKKFLWGVVYDENFGHARITDFQIPKHMGINEKHTVKGKIKGHVINGFLDLAVVDPDDKPPYAWFPDPNSYDSSKGRGTLQIGSKEFESEWSFTSGQKLGKHKAILGLFEDKDGKRTCVDYEIKEVTVDIF